MRFVAKDTKLLCCVFFFLSPEVGRETPLDIQRQRVCNWTGLRSFQFFEAVKQIGLDPEVLVDTGIMHGADIIASVAKAAKLALVGRAYLYGLMVGGQEGVRKR